MSHVAELNQSVHAGDWVNCPDFTYQITPLQELYGRTLGIIGFGQIGQRVARAALAFGINQPFLLVPVGIVYIAETLSVMLQVTYFKLTHGKRLFKMSPLHHHFEMSGWSENKIVIVFSIVTLLGCGAAAGLLFL